MTTYRCEHWIGATWIDSWDVDADSPQAAAEKAAEGWCLPPGEEHEIRVIRADSTEWTFTVSGSAIYSAREQV